MSTSVPGATSPAWPGPAISDDEGRFTLRGLGRGLMCRLFIDDPRFALQLADDPDRRRRRRPGDPLVPFIGTDQGRARTGPEADHDRRRNRPGRSPGA